MTKQRLWQLDALRGLALLRNDQFVMTTAP